MCGHGLHEGLCTAHRLLRFPLADRRHPIVACMPEGKQVGQAPAQTRGIDLPALDQLPDKAGLDPVVPPAAGRVSSRQSSVEQRRNGRMKAGIIGTADTAVGPAVRQLTFRAGEIFLGLRQIVMHGCHSIPELYQSRCAPAMPVEQTSVYSTERFSHGMPYLNVE